MVSRVLGQGLTTTIVGIVVGLLGAMSAARVLDGVLFGASPLDARTYVVVVALLFVVAIAACVVPAWRATRCIR